GLNGPGKRIAGERRAGLDAGAVPQELRLLGGVRSRWDRERAAVGGRAGDPDRHRSVCPGLFRTHSAQPDEAGWGTASIAIIVAPGTPAAEYAFARRRQIGLDLAEYRGRPSRRIDVVGQPLEVVHVPDRDGALEERSGPPGIEYDGSPCAEGLSEIALQHRGGVDGPFDPVVILEAPDGRETLGLLAVGRDQLQRLCFPRPERRDLHRRVESDHVRPVDGELSARVRLAQAREYEVAGAVKRVQATEPGGRVLGIPLLLRGADDGDQFEPRVQPVA